AIDRHALRACEASDRALIGVVEAFTSVHQHKTAANAHAAERAAQAALARDFVVNPSAVVFDPSWRTPAVRALALAAHDQREQPAGTLEADRLAVLADALEEAGCTNADLLGHLRGPGPH